MGLIKDLYEVTKYVDTSANMYGLDRYHEGFALRKNITTERSVSLFRSAVDFRFINEENSLIMPGTIVSYSVNPKEGRLLLSGSGRFNAYIQNKPWFAFTASTLVSAFIAYSLPFIIQFIWEILPKIR